MSFIEMPSDKVRKMAERAIQRIKERRERDWVDSIELRRKEYEKSWWRKLWKMPVPSDADIRREIEHEDWTGTLINAYGLEAERVAQRLIRVAEKGETVYVSAEDVQRIGG